MNGFAGLGLRIVEAGTVVEGPDGKTETVDESHIVRKGSDLYLTRTAFAALKRASESSAPVLFADPA